MNDRIADISRHHKLLAALILLIAIGIATLLHGDLPWSAVYHGALDRLFGNSSAWNPLLDERLPRLIVIVSTGAALTGAGSVMQALFNNPLASPNLLGISSGASLFAIFVLINGLHLRYPFAISLAAALGALLALFAVQFMAKKIVGDALYGLILAGVALSALLYAIQAAIIYGWREEWSLVQTIAEWEAGSTFDRSWLHVHMQLPLTLVGLLGCWRYRAEIDILSLGDDEATSLGVDVATVRSRLFISVALLVGGAMAAVGMIAFLGLILPLLIRHYVGAAIRTALPFSLVCGSLCFASIDLTMRLFGFHALSVGHLFAILGGLCFIVMIQMRKMRVRWGGDVRS